VTFRGNFPTKVDSQGRIKIPAAHRRILEEQYGSELYVTSLKTDSVMIYPMSEWEQLEAKLHQLPNSLPQKAKFLRNANYFGQVAVMDKQGRVLIQPHLRQAAGIDGDVAVMGNLNHLLLWNNDRIRNLIETEPFTDADASVLAELGI
jgi:MraZ protein